ncbi:hypothetical protein GCM10026988_10330 [Vibrio panuliri]
MASAICRYIGSRAIVTSLTLVRYFSNLGTVFIYAIVNRIIRIHFNMTSSCFVYFENKQYNINTFIDSNEIWIADHLYLIGIIGLIVVRTTMNNVTMGQTL